MAVSTEAIRRARDQRVRAIREKKARLLDFLTRGVIAEEDYRDQAQRLEGEITEASFEMIDATMEERELRGLLDFAEHILENPGRSWAEFNLEHRQRFQRIAFSEGLTLEGDSQFGTAVTSSVFSYIRAIQMPECQLAAPTGATWNQISSFLRDLGALRAAA